MPSSKNSSSSSLESFHIKLDTARRQAIVEAALLSPSCILHFEHFFADDEDALAQITTFRSMNLIVAYASLHPDATQSHLIISQAIKIKHLTMKILIRKKIEDALLSPDFPCARDSLCSQSYCYTASPEPVEQLAVRTGGAPRRARKQKREVAFGVRLSCPIRPRPESIKEEKEDQEDIIITPYTHTQSKETFRDRCGNYTSTITCRYCSLEGHRQINCPRYYCHVCMTHVPKHLSAFCPDLKGTKIINAKPGTHAFHYQLKQWENTRDNEADEFEAQVTRDADLDPELYRNEDF
ncbi:uncharacterized protein EDB93DRAFT_1256517 [Suillus bovinus]|uniref:uncharacterized protein n=1 Tax=Suillus bovinus TaxID=48563 RepID=UPI001B85CBE4|nr:uncharacterized protein EDB93DRAFT_1256517 [Suillus bovinus]KAG2128891.1 hypothetical protein EDB93DRAFT_1256517 [Suillus bovinus]